MTALMIVAMLGAGALTIVLGSLAMLQAVTRRERLAGRLLTVTGGTAPVRTVRSPLALLGDLGRAVANSGFLSPRTLVELEQTLIRSGFRGDNALGMFVGGKIVGLIAIPLTLWLVLPEQRLGALLHHLLVAAGAMGGMLLPDMITRRIRARYVADVESGLPDALDMLVICAEAGLSLVPAVARVSVEIRGAHEAVAEELTLTADELHVVSDMRIALTNMGRRTNLPALKRLGVTLIQAHHYGTPLAHALRTLAAEMRGEMLVRFEERAAKLPTMLTVPMILFILPSLFLVVGGPAMVHVARLMRH